MIKPLKLCCALNGHKVHESCKCDFKICKPCTKDIRAMKPRPPSKYFKNLNLIGDAHWEYDMNCPRFDRPDAVRSFYGGEGLA